MSGSIRQRILEELRQKPATLRELSRELGLREGETAEHLAHALRSLEPGERVAEDPALCRACGFAFRKRDRVTTPGRCPRCRGERIQPARFRIEPRWGRRARADAMMDTSTASYLTSLADGRLRAAVAEAYRRLGCCELCPRRCRIDRVRGERGFCRTGLHAKVASAGPHFGEEGPLVGAGGSGTIFFSECNLRCVFCQNWDISWEGAGRETSLPDLARTMLALEQRGCHNVNFVTPSHVVPQILGAAALAARRGLSVPLIYNTSGYDSVETLKLLDGVVDIYMPDLKWVSPEVGQRLAGAPDYWETARDAVKEMYRQVGDLQLDRRGVARRGLLVRHLVMPDGLSGTERVMEFLAREISPRTYVNVMSQYRPSGDARAMPGLGRRISGREHARAVDAARRAGLTRLDGLA